MWPRDRVPSMAPWLSPPKKLGLGSWSPTLRCLIVLCSYCNRAGITWVGQAKIAQDLQISRQAVTKQLKLLIQTGYVEIVKKGFRGERTNTIRVIFDPTVDAETAIAITSAQESTRPPTMDDRPDPEGQRRVAQLISKALKQPPKKEFQMPSDGQTMTVRKMKEEIAKAKAKRSHKQPSEVANEAVPHRQPTPVDKSSHRQPDRQPPEVAPNTEEHRYLDSIKVNNINNLNIVLSNQNRVELRKKGLTDAEIDDNLAHLLEAYRSEGLTPNPDRLVSEITQLAKVGL